MLFLSFPPCSRFPDCRGRGSPFSQSYLVFGDGCWNRGTTRTTYNFVGSGSVFFGLFLRVIEYEVECFGNSIAPWALVDRSRGLNNQTGEGDEGVKPERGYSMGG